MSTLVTLPIPLTTLNGTQTFGPASVPQGVSWVRLTLNRNVGASPLNGDDTLRITLNVEISLDSGQTWQGEISATAEGGIFVWRGTQQNQTFIQDSPIAGDPSSTTRRIRATVSTNAPVSISGSLTAGD